MGNYGLSESGNRSSIVLTNAWRDYCKEFGLGPGERVCFCLGSLKEGTLYAPNDLHPLRDGLRTVSGAFHQVLADGDMSDVVAKLFERQTAVHEIFSAMSDHEPLPREMIRAMRKPYNKLKMSAGEILLTAGSEELVRLFLNQGQISEVARIYHNARLNHQRL